MKSEVLRRISVEIAKTDIELSNIPNKKRKVNNDEDYLVKTIGAFGLWQGTISVTVSLIRAIALWNMMSIVFLTLETEFTCVEFNNNVTFEVKKLTCYNSCVQYNYSSIVGNNIIADFQLICENAWLASFTQTILMFGVLVGVSLFGWISDRFGRRIALILSTLLNAVFMIALPFAPNYIIFTSIRFVIGIMTGGALVIGVIITMEIIGKQHREVAGALALIPDGLAEASLAGFAYFTSKWQGFVMWYGAATWIILILILFVPESPRWLVAKGKVNEAIEVVTKAAIRNKLDTSNIKETITKAVEEIKLQEDEEVQTSYLDLFKTKEMSVLTVTVIIIWFSCGMCFYGIYQYVTLIGFDPYITVILTGLVQVPFCPVGIILNKRFGRRITSISAIAVVGTAMLILIFVPQGHWLGTMLGVVGFTAASIGFSVGYIYNSELFPTPLRNMAFGLSSGGAKIGAMISPFIANLLPRWLPSLIFGLLPFVGAAFIFKLPETKGQNLKDSVKN